MLAAALMCVAAAADEPTNDLGNGIVLKGVAALSHCSSEGPDCVRLQQLQQEYFRPDRTPKTELNIYSDGSPWTLLGPGNRFLTPEQFALVVKDTDAWRQQAPFQTVRLLSSFSSVRVQAGKPSLSERLAAALGVQSVEGADGFIWMKPDGSWRTSHQAVTTYYSVNAYVLVRRGDDVMLSARHAFAPNVEAVAVTQNRPEALFRAGLSAEVFELNREKALEKFRAAAEAGHAIAGYNAAQILLDRDGRGDRDAAVALLRAVAARGDAPAVDQLRTLGDKI